ncbi:hypothetical protein [Bryocella elongata]|uniref:hypothetical protein n=1 Tax=Bryocella elongata TaxID=863522 RepID=UPI001F2C971E|nr:hypothetical protein [Bryocella elongata]
MTVERRSDDGGKKEGGANGSALSVCGEDVKPSLASDLREIETDAVRYGAAICNGVFEIAAAIEVVFDELTI